VSASGLEKRIGTLLTQHREELEKLVDQALESELQWLRCDAKAACAPIPGATTSTYAVAPADVCSTLLVAANASTPAGSATVRSLPTAIVA